MSPFGGPSLSLSLLFTACLLFILALAQGVSFSWPGLIFLLGSFSAALAATVFPVRMHEKSGSRLVLLALQGLVFTSLVLGSLGEPGIHIRADSSTLPFALGTLGLAVVTLDYSVQRILPAPWRFPAALVCFAGSGLWMLHVSPQPFIDVWSMQTEAARYLLAGENPYSQLYSNIYGDNLFVSESLIVDGKVRSFQYPPLTLLFSTLSFALSDVRVGSVFAISATAYAMRSIGRKCGLPAGHCYELVPLCLLCLPSTLLLVEQAWTEPYLAAAAVVFVASLTGTSRARMSLSLALFLGSKQYAVVFLPILWARRHVDWRVGSLGCAAAFATALPFLLWDARGVWNGLILFQIQQVFRPDSLSISSVVFQEVGVQLPRWFPLVTATLVSGWLALCRNRSVALTAVGGALVYQGLFLTSPQAFMNYFWFAGVLLLLGTFLELCRREACSSARMLR